MERWVHERGRQAGKMLMGLRKMETYDRIEFNKGTKTNQLSKIKEVILGSVLITFNSSC